MRARTRPAGTGTKPRQNSADEIDRLPLRDRLWLHKAATFYVQWLRPEVWANPAWTSQLLQPSLDIIEKSVRERRLSVTPAAIEFYLRRAIDDERERRGAQDRRDR